MAYSWQPWLLIAFIVLHGPNGEPVYIVPSKITAVLRSQGVNGNTAVVSDNGTFYVRETVEQVLTLIGDSK